MAAATNTDLDTGSYFELAARAALACLAGSEVSVDEVGMLINAGVFRDNNICEPAVSALIQKRIGLGLEYQPGRLPAFSFDLMHGASGLLHAIIAAESFLAMGDVRYALLVAGDAHPSMRRHVPGFPYTTGAAVLLLGTSPTVGGFGRLHTRESTEASEPSAWVDMNEVGANGRSAMRVRRDGPDALELAAAAVRDCVDREGLDSADFDAHRAVLLAPAPMPGFAEILADTLGLQPDSVVGVPERIGDPYTAAPVHAYLSARESGVLDTAEVTLFLTADDAAAACLAYRPHHTPVAAAPAAGARVGERR
ncbi:3-oxoacyl-[acyl-carrier-protein] synthase-3 [Nocardia tenerifensis]|uniref:3-oxoacyl-[acyl-carrier-protein] synthase-3 n=2 Tax=Nocardia tenerifensis TaxID=228006 RepID=A0A318JT33_9NOCA|nr:3-oxoacyl-[acyl-carrier-protein] synthase-3 [Nocardia tenerifensis]